MGWFKKRLENLQDSIIFALLVAVGVAVWSLISNLPLQIIFVIGIATFAATLTVLNQTNIWRDRRRKQISKFSNQEVEDTILKWITIPSFSVQRNVDPNALFSFMVKDSQERAVTIARAKDDPSQLVLAIKKQLLEDTKTKLEALEKSTSSQLIFNLRLELIRLGIGFQGVDWPLNQITLSDFVALDDSLTKTYFLGRVLFIRRAQLLIGECIGQRL